MFSIRKALEENASRLADLIHAKEKLEIINHEGLINKIQRVIDTYVTTSLELVEMGHRVQALDAMKRKNPPVRGA